MGTAQLGSWSFDIDPESVEWDFSIKTSVERTIGGKVVQVLGVNIGDLRLSGHFGSGGRTVQQRFVDWFRQEARAQADGAAYEPLRFLLPHRRWDMQVYLKSFSEPGSSRSVNLDVGNFSPSFTLTLHITQDHSAFTVAKETQLGFIERISREFGWERTEYNGPMTTTEVQDLIRNQGTSVDEVLGLFDPSALTGSTFSGTLGGTFGQEFSFEAPTAPPSPGGDMTPQ